MKNNLLENFEFLNIESYFSIYPSEFCLHKVCTLYRKEKEFFIIENCFEQNKIYYNRKCPFDINRYYIIISYSNPRLISNAFYSDLDSKEVKQLVKELKLILFSLLI